MLTEQRVPARPVALARILLSLGAALTCAEGAVLLTAVRDGAVRLPVTGGGYSAMSIPPQVWLLVMVTASLLMLAGAAVPVCAATVAAGNVALLLADQQLYSNHRFLLVLLCVWFTLAQSDRALSVAARVRRRPVQDVPWWPQLLIIATVSSCYVFAGISKVNPEFLSGDLMASMSPDWVPSDLLSWATGPTEILIGAGLWWRPLRRTALALGAVLHLSIIALLGTPVVFTAFALLCVSAYPLVWTLPRRDQAEAAATQRSSVA